MTLIQEARFLLLTLLFQSTSSFDSDLNDRNGAFDGIPDYRWQLLQVGDEHVWVVPEGSTHHLTYELGGPKLYTRVGNDTLSDTEPKYMYHHRWSSRHSPRRVSSREDLYLDVLEFKA